MQTCQIEISKLYGLDGTATLDAFTFGTFRDDNMMDKRPAIIVVPGGGYAMVSKREGEPIAAYFMGKGYNAFVLTYSVRPQAYYPAQLLQLCASVDYILSMQTSCTLTLTAYTWLVFPQAVTL